MHFKDVYDILRKNKKGDVLLSVLIGIFSVLSVILSIASLVLLALGVFMKGKQLLALIGAGLQVLVSVIGLITSILISFTFLDILLAILSIIPSVLLAAFLYIKIYKPEIALPKFAEYAPAGARAILLILSILITFITSLVNGYFVYIIGTLIGTLLGGVLGVAIYAFVCLKFNDTLPSFLQFKKSDASAAPAAAPAAAPTATARPAAAPTANASSESGYSDMMTHVLFLFITCGIYLYIWIYKTTMYTNKCRSMPQRNAVTELLLCMFVPFYHIFWTYKTAQCIDRMAAEKNISSDITNMCLILAIFISIVPPILMQSKINEICRGGSAPAANPAARPSASAASAAAAATAAAARPAAPVRPVASTSVADELAKFKALLDQGAITLEEYEAKKRELLNQ